MILCPPKPAAPIDLDAPGAASHAPAAAGSHGGVRYLLQPRLARGFPRQSVPSNHPANAFDLRQHTLRYAATTVVLCRPNESSIVSTLAEDDSSNGALRTAHKQSEGPRRYAYCQNGLGHGQVVFQAAIAAISGLTPRMFMTRVRL
jgi:hypothetical protein